MLIYPPTFPGNRRTDPKRQGELRVYKDIVMSPSPGITIYGGKVGPEAPEIDYSMWLQKEARASAEVKAGRHSFDHGEWLLHSVNGSEVMDSPVIQARDAAISIRDAVKESLGRKVFVLAFLIFPDMDPDQKIIEEAGRQKVHVTFGSRGTINEILRVAAAEEIFMPPTASHIQEEARLFVPGIEYPKSGTATSRGDTTPSSKVSMGMVAHQVIIQHVDVINLYPDGGGAKSVG